MIHMIGQQEKPPECPICNKAMIFKVGKKGAVYVCYVDKVAIGVQDPLILQQNLIKAGEMMKPGDKVIIGQLEWEVVLVKKERDALIRRPNPKDSKKMDFGLVEVIDFVFDKERRTWIEVDALPEDGDSIFKSK